MPRSATHLSSIIFTLLYSTVSTMIAYNNESNAAYKSYDNESVSLPLDLDIDDDTSGVENQQPIQLYSRNLTRAIKIKDHDYFLRPPYFPLILKPRSTDFIFPTKFFNKKIYATKDGHLLDESKDDIMKHFQRQLQICRNIYTQYKKTFAHTCINKHHEFTQVANVLWDRYKHIEINVNKVFLEVPKNLKFKMKRYHMDEKRISMEHWWNIEYTLDMEFNTLFNKIRYDLYKAFDIFDTELHMTCFHLDKHLPQETVEESTTFAPLWRLEFNDSLVESESHYQD